MQHKILLFDIETAPLLSYVWTAKTEYVPYKQMIHDSFMLTWSAKWYGEKEMYGDLLTSKEARKQNDTRIVHTLSDMIRSADVVIAHNVDRFDIPMLNNRLLILGIEPLGPVRTLDTLKLSKQNFRLAYNKLDYLAEVLGLPGKIDTTFELWENAYHGDEDALNEMYTYNQQDVVVLEQVFDRLKPYVRGLPRLFDADFDGQMICLYCGGKHFQRRGFYRTQASNFIKYKCQNKKCGRFSRAKATEKDKRASVHPL